LAFLAYSISASHCATTLANALLREAESRESNAWYYQYRSCPVVEFVYVLLHHPNFLSPRKYNNNKYIVATNRIPKLEETSYELQIPRIS